MTHTTLDQLPPSRAVTHLRAVLVSTGVLPERDEYLLDLERWIPRALQPVRDAEDRRLLQSFATWTHLRRLRRHSSRRPLSYLQARNVKRDLQACITLLTWLREQGKTLATSIQSDIGRWLSFARTDAYDTRGFVAWCVRARHAHDIEVPACSRRDGSPEQLDPGERWQISRRLLHDTNVAASDRVAGCLLLLYGKPVAQIITLTTADVAEAGHGIQLTLGTRPLDISEPLGSLLRELARDRRGYASVGHSDANPWLFPGGRPITARQLTIRLNKIGVRPRAGRTTALMDLAGGLPTVVLSRLLGISIKSATAWSQAAGNTRPGYAAEVARRALRNDRVTLD